MYLYKWARSTNLVRGIKIPTFARKQKNWHEVLYIQMTLVGKNSSAWDNPNIFHTCRQIIMSPSLLRNLAMWWPTRILELWVARSNPASDCFLIEVNLKHRNRFGTSATHNHPDSRVNGQANRHNRFEKISTYIAPFDSSSVAKHETQQPRFFAFNLCQYLNWLASDEDMTNMYVHMHAKRPVETLKTCY
jgi:hypothetical protein